MRILTRYVLLDLVKVFLTALAVLTLTVLLVGVVREALMQNLPMRCVAELIPYVLPDALRIAVPVTLLLTATTVYGRMAGGNEVLAIKSLGLSPMRLIQPCLWLALILSLITVWLNDVAVSWGRRGAQRVVVRAVEDIVYRMLQTQHHYRSPGMSVHVQRVEGRRLIRPTLSLQQPGGPAVTVTAEEAELRADHRRDVLEVTLRNGTLDVEGRVSVEFPDVQRHTVPLRAASQITRLADHPSSIPLLDIPGEIDRQRRKLCAMQTRPVAEAAMHLATGRLDRLARPGQADPSDAELRRARERLSRLKTEPHRRWAAGLSCFCFIVVGAPMAVRLRGRDFLTSFFLCFLPILIVYYPLFAYGIGGAKSGTLPPWGVWAGNLMLLAWGSWLMARVRRF